MASLDMNLHQLDAFLTSQSKKKDGIREDDVKIISRFWKTHKTKIHDSMVSKSIYNDRLKSLNWRIDVKTNANNEEQGHASTAIVEMNIQSQACSQVSFKHYVISLHYYQIVAEHISDLKCLNLCVLEDSRATKV